VKPAPTVSLVLHAHLPFGLRPELPMSLEEAWLHEAVIHCYLPLLQVLERAPAAETPSLAVSLSPTLLEMWAHPEFPGRCAAHVGRGIALFEQESANRALPPERRRLAARYAEQWRDARAAIHQMDGDLIAAWVRLSRGGKVELLTTAMTHAFLPAHQNSASRRLQIELGVARFQELTGLDAAGFWLPECGYFPGLENDLAAAGARWFGVENLGGPCVRECPNGVRAIARDSALSRKVWDARAGYPGNPLYREFHRDAVHELSADQAGLYRAPDGQSLPLGMKYWRVTGAPDKAFYDPEAANTQAGADARDFLGAIAAEASEPILFLPFDAELFGHWWFEGPRWLEQFLQAASADPVIRLAAPGAALESVTGLPIQRPAPSTWGRHADYSYWVNHETDWIYPLLAQAEKVFGEAAARAETYDAGQEAAFRQLVRELLLAQASDWPFMIRNGATADYARERIQRHLARLHFLAEQIEGGVTDREAVEALRSLDPILPNLSTPQILGETREHDRP